LARCLTSTAKTLQRWATGCSDTLNEPDELLADEKAEVGGLQEDIAEDAAADLVHKQHLSTQLDKKRRRKKKERKKEQKKERKKEQKKERDHEPSSRGRWRQWCAIGPRTRYRRACSPHTPRRPTPPPKTGANITQRTQRRKKGKPAETAALRHPRPRRAAKARPTVAKGLSTTHTHTQTYTHTCSCVASVISTTCSSKASSYGNHSTAHQSS
jgi:hypothetical protein